MDDVKTSTEVVVRNSNQDCAVRNEAGDSFREVLVRALGLVKFGDERNDLLK